MFDQSASAASTEVGPASLLDRIRTAHRAESRAAGERLVAIGELDSLQARARSVNDLWVSDSFTAVSVDVAAALNISGALASSYLGYARALRDRLPKVGALLVAGDIDYWMFRIMVFRTDLIEDPEVLAAVDGKLAAGVLRWPGLTQRRLAGYIDKIVARADRDAVRQRRRPDVDREVTITDNGQGMCDLYGRLPITDAHLLDARLDALAASVCDQDPRNRRQRRADALAALAGGADRLGCRCERPDCAAAGRPAPRPVVIHVLAEQASLDGRGDHEGTLIGDDALVPADLLVELARTAVLRPLVHPADTPPEQGYVPSRALADFVRCRDLTCRFPGCDAPAVDCDLDHTIPHGRGGRTHASNLKALCRHHHLVKTFLRWEDQQLPDGTVIWRSPDGSTYVTTPGSAWLFPSLCTPTVDPSVPRPEPGRTADGDGARTLRMPCRRRTRAQSHARYVAAERRQNRQSREARREARQALIEATWGAWTAPRDDDNDDPPPF